MDVMMPRLDGLQALRLLQMRDEAPPPVIFVSCLAHSAEMAEAHGLSALDFLVKGRFSMSQLVSKVLNVCLRTQPMEFVYGRTLAEIA
jgi:DNA-binding response OmpR family regulator